MRYKDSIIEAILIERELGKTYKEISDKLKISIYHVKKAVVTYGSRERFKKYRLRESRKNKNGNLDNE